MGDANTLCTEPGSGGGGGIAVAGTLYPKCSKYVLKICAIVLSA